MGLILLVVLFSFGAAPALGHASLLSSEPPTGAVLSEAPHEVVLTFSEPASPLAIQLIDDKGNKAPVQGDQVTSVESRIVVSLPAALSKGTHVLSWRAASSDGHPIAGTVIFSIGSPSDTGPIVAPAVDWVVRALLWFARATMLTTLLLGAGSSGFRMVAEALPVKARRATLAAVTIGGIAAVGSVPLHGLDALGRPLSDIAAPEVWAVTMNAGYGASVVAALIAIALATISVTARKPNLAGWISVLSLVAVGLTATLSGHASSADPRWLTRSMVFLHVVSIAWWAGELLPLALILRQSHAIADPPLMRFSRFIPFVIAPLVISGVTLAVIQLGPPSAAWLTPYTYLFAAKLILLFILFAVAAWNRWYLTARVVAGQDEATRHLRHAIVLEIVLIMVIVGVAAGWRFTPPPRTLAVELASGTTLALAFPSGDLTGHVTIAPARVGHNSVALALTRTGDDAKPDVKSVRVFLSSAEVGINKLEVPAAMAEQGTWQADDVLIPAMGSWTVSVEVRISDFVQTKASAELSIQ
jgi:copper transport protein